MNWLIDELIKKQIDLGPAQSTSECPTGAAALFWQGAKSCTHLDVNFVLRLILS